MNKQELLEIIDEVVKIYFDSNCSVEEAVRKAKEVMNSENRIARR